MLEGQYREQCTTRKVGEGESRCDVLAMKKIAEDAGSAIANFEKSGKTASRDANRECTDRDFRE